MMSSVKKDEDASTPSNRHTLSYGLSLDQSDATAERPEEKEIEDERCVSALNDLEAMMRKMLQSVQDESSSFDNDDINDLFGNLINFTSSKETQPKMLKSLSRRLHIVELFVNFIEKIPSITSYHYNCIQYPMFFFIHVANTPLMRDSLAKYGIFDALTDAFFSIATVSMLLNRVPTPWIVTLIVFFLYHLCNDHSTNFTFAKPLVSNSKFAKTFGTVFNLTWKNIIDDHKQFLISTGFVLCRCAYRCGCEESFVELSRFPMAAINEIQECDNKLELVFQIVEGFGSGPFLVKSILKHIPDIIELVVSNMEKEDLSWKECNPSSLWNGTNSEAGTQAILPFVERIYKMFQSSNKYSTLYYACYGAIGNICRYTTHEQRQALRDLNIVEGFSALMHSSKPEDRPTQAACIVANLIGHIESHALLSDTGEVIDLLAVSLRKAWNDESFEGGTSEPWEPLQALSHFASADDNKEKITATCVDLILEILETPRCQDERTEKFAVVTLCTLAQLPTFGERTPRVKTIFAKIKEAGLSDFSRRQAAIGLFLLENVVNSASEDEDATVFGIDKRKKKKFKKSLLSRKTSRHANSFTNSNAANHVMLSYPWAHQNVMKKVFTSLKTSGYNVWMDIEKMGGSILEAMAAAVEQADVVVVCLCEEYFLSNACRTEAQYAYKRKKPLVFIRVEDYDPTGWLGALCGTNLYVDFIQENDYNNQVPQLLKEINQYVSPCGVKDEASLPSHATQHQIDSLTKEVSYWKKKAQTAEKEVDKLQATSDITSVVRREMAKLKLELSTLTDSLVQRVESICFPPTNAGTLEESNSAQNMHTTQMKSDISSIKSEMGTMRSDVQALTQEVKSILEYLKQSSSQSTT
eukprot:m.75028 g.75028  ORF g.75028 m.75028 type:complete len:867 (+) comp8467_c1_seq1:71-2671(+)